MSVQDILAIIAIATGALAVPAAVVAYRSSRRDRRREDFRRHLARLPLEQRQLVQQEMESAPREWLSSASLWSRPGWTPDTPYDLDEIDLRWSPPPEVDEPVESAKRSAARMFSKLGLTGRPGYSGAVTQVGGMTGLFDGTIYRPVEIDFSGTARSIRFTTGSYFDYLDTSEVLAFEAHVRRRAGRASTPGGRSYRSRLEGPFDLRNRVTSLGIDTLTVRVGSGDAGFFLHSRDSRSVVNNSSQLAVIPAGEFTPSDVTREAIHNDLDLWRNIMREYAEEFLGAEEAQGRGGTWIDYDEDEPYRQLNQGRAAGRIRVRVLGLGMDPVAWKPEPLTVCLIDSECFDSIFSAMRPRNDEGLVIQGRGNRGLPFDEATVHRYVEADNISPTARSCLQLTWRHRSSLGLDP